MVKAKARTLKRVKKPSKKTYLLKGGQHSLEYINLYNSFTKNLEKKKELYESIHNDAAAIYDLKTSEKNNSFRSSANDTIVFLEDFYQSTQQQLEQKRITLQQNLLQYPVKYNQYFVETNVNLDNLVNEINDTLDYARNLNSNFQNKEVHVHLIQKNFNLLNDVKLKINDFNQRLQSLFDSLDKIYKIVKEQPETNDTDDVETYKRNIQDAIATVNRPIPEGFIPNSNTQFIKGCPLGTVLENNQCIYYNGSNVVESVPFQDKLINTKSDYVVWFNQINQQSVGIPTVFKKKPIEYLLPLTQEDAKLYKAKYVVSEQNGTIKLDRNNMKKFVNEISCCWDQDSGVMSTTPNDSYYIDYDNLPQPVKLLEKVSPMIRQDLSSVKYVRLLNEEDQILSGIQYLETDISGNIKYVDKNVIPFYPDLEEYTFTNNVFEKNAYNNVDLFKVILLEGTLNKIPELNVNIQTNYDTKLLNSFKYNIIPSLFINKYVEINIDKYYSPFVLPSVLINEGDYFLIHNTSINYPIVFNISKTFNESHVILYPNEIYCFIYSNESNNLQYGFIKYNLHDTLYNVTNKVSKIMPLNKYVFVETKDIYDGETFVMNSIEPILDSQKRAIIVPNFDESTKTYYNFDDVFQLNPIQVQIIESEVKVVNDKTFDSGTYKNLEESKEHVSYTSPYITKTSSNVLLFCNESGKPLIDMMGYFIPVITPVFYNGTNYFWLNYEKESTVEFKADYIDALILDSNYLAENQFSTQYYASYSSMNGGQAPAPAPVAEGEGEGEAEATKLYTNKDSKPIVSKANSFVIAQDLSGLIMLSTNIPNYPSFSTELLNIQEIQDSVIKINISNSIEIYIENTNLLIHQYADISGNMNNLESLKLELQYQSQLGTKTSLDKVNTIYSKVLETQDKLKSYLQTREFSRLNSIRISEMKELRNNELEIIKTSINNLQASLTSLNSRVINTDSKRDYSILNDTLKKLKSAYDAINYNIDSINNYDTLKSQENNTKLLLNSVTVLQNNIDSFEESLRQNELQNSQSELKLKENILAELQTTLQNTIDSVNNLKSRINEINESNKIKFNSIFTNIENINTQVKDDKTTIVNTLDTIDDRISKYESFIQNVNMLKQNILNLLEESKAVSTQEIQNAKLLLNNKIQTYKTTHENIKSLLASNEEEYDSQLRNYFTEIISIETSIADENDLTMLQSKNSRIDEILTLEKTIQTELQTIQLNRPPEPQTGGKKKRHSTRKHKTNHR